MTDSQRKPANIPLWAWPFLTLSVFAVSSAGVVFKTFDETVPPVLLASWRLQVTSYALFIFCVMQYRRMPEEDQRRMMSLGPLTAITSDNDDADGVECNNGISALPRCLFGIPGTILTLSQAPLLVMIFSGCCLALHFGGWVWGLAHTSLPHSLLLVSATPLLTASGMVIFRLPISKGEMFGTGIGTAGAALLLVGASGREGEEVTLAGDAASLMGSFAMIGYLSAGRHLRSWMPLFVYIVPVTFTAAVLMAVFSLLVDGSSVGISSDPESLGIWGWVNEKFLLRVLYLGLIPGIVGHVNFNMLLKYISPLVITLTLNFEPVIGSILGWFVGVSDEPGVWTYVGGVLMLAATMIVSVASARRETDTSNDSHSDLKYEQIEETDDHHIERSIASI